MAYVIAIATQKGGAGKTTLTINLGAAFARAGAAVLLVDADQQGSLRQWHESSGGDRAIVIGLDRETVARDIASHRGRFDVILIDCPPQHSRMEAECIKAADLVLIPCMPCLSDARSAFKTVNQIKDRQTITDGAPRAMLVANRVEAGTVLGKDLQDLLPTFGLPVCKTVIQKRQNYPVLYNTGGTVYDAPKSAAAAEIDALRLEVEEAASVAA